MSTYHFAQLPINVSSTEYSWSKNGLRINEFETMIWEKINSSQTVKPHLDAKNENLDKIIGLHIGAQQEQISELNDQKECLLKLYNMKYLSLQVLRVESYTLTQLDEKNLGEFLGFLQQIQKLKGLKLNLRWNSINEKGAEHVAAALSKLTQLSQLNLNLSLNSIGEKGAEHVAAALSKLTQLSQLNLDLLWNSINEKGAKQVATALSKLTQLSQLDLNLGLNNIQNGDQIKDAIKKSLHNAKLKIEV